MNTYATSIRLYQHVNVSGALSRAVLEPRRWQQRVGRVDRLLDERQANRPNRMQAAESLRTQALRYGSFVGGNGFWQLQRTFASAAAAGLSMHRAMAPLLLPLILSAQFNAMSLAALGACLEWIAGRGHDEWLDPHPSGRFPRGEHAAMLRLLGHHGALGLALERIPVSLAHRLHRAGHGHLAALCMCGAVLGRTLLQVPRMGTVALFVTFGGGFAAVMTGVAIGSRLCMAALATVALCVAEALHVLAQWIRAAFSIESAAFNDQVRVEATQAMKPIFDVKERPLQNGEQDPRELEEVLSAANQAADRLRAFCRHQPNETALRGGLALIRDTLELSWGAAKVGFAPLELAPPDRPLASLQARAH